MKEKQELVSGWNGRICERRKMREENKESFINVLEELLVQTKNVWKMV